MASPSPTKPKEKLDSAEGMEFTPLEAATESAEGLEFVPLSAAPSAEGLEFVPLEADEDPGFFKIAGEGLAQTATKGLGIAPNSMLGKLFGMEDKDKPFEFKGATVPERTPTQEAVGRSAIDPNFVSAIKANLDAMPEDKRAVSLQNLTKQPGVYGTAARDIAAQYAATEKALPTVQGLTDASIEARTAYFIKNGMNPEAARNRAMGEALAGMALNPRVQSMNRDVVGEVAGREAAIRKKELEGAGFVRRVGAEMGALNTQTGLGLQRMYADVTGNEELQRYTAGLSRIEKERAGAIPEGESIFAKSAQHAMASFVTQAPMLVLGALTGTAVPVLLQAGFNQFAQSYNESRDAGVKPTEALGRSVPMAAAEVFFERFGMTKALAGLRKYVADGGNDIAKYVGKSIATEIPSELATTLTQYGVDVLPSVGLNKNPSLFGLYQQLEETLRQTVLQSGVTAGTTIGAVKGVQKLQSALEPKGYKEEDYSGLSEMMARRRGFLNPIGQRPVAPPPASTVGAPEQEWDPYEEEYKRVVKVEELAAQIAATGVPEDDAMQMAERQMQDFEKEQAAKAQRSKDAIAKLVTSAPQGRIDELTQEFIDAGVEPQVALQQATQQANEEAEADAQAEKESRTRSKKPANKPVTTTTGTGVSVAEQPSEVATAEGTPGTEPDGVVSTEQDAGESAVGEGAQPTAVEELYAAAKPWDTENRSRRNDEWQAGAAESNKTFNAVAVEGADVPAHGMAKVSTLKGGIDALVSLLGGIDPNRTLYYDKLTSPEAGTGVGTGTAGGYAYRDGPFIVTFRKGLDGKQPTTEDIRGVLVNPANAEIVPQLQAMFPNLTVRSYDQVADVIAASNVTQPTTSTTTTEETASGTETPETQQAEAQGEAAPAVSTTPKTKRGRPTVLTEEQRQQKLTESKPVQAAKARAERAVTRILKSLEKLATPLDEGSFNDDDALKEAQAERVSQRRQNTRELLALQGDPLLRGTKVAERVKAALEHPQTSDAREKAEIKKGMDLQKQGKNLYSKIGQGVADPKFAEFTTGSQALSYIIKTGNPFQRKLGRRLKSFVSGVKFVVIEKGQPLPEELQKSKNLRHWNRALALYTESYKTKEKVIYVRGASFGAGQAINNVTVLHELLHAATNRKISLALELIKNGMRLDSPLVQAANDLMRTMASANYQYKRLNAQWDVDKQKRKLSPQIGALNQFGEAFTRPEEFIAYGLTDEDMQEFLMTAEGYEEDDTFFNRFVRSIRDLFGMSDGDTNALSDLIVVTDRLLSARVPVGARLAQDLVSAVADHEVETAATPGGDLRRLANLLGSKLYGEPTDMARVSVKELFQNGFDAIKESMEKRGLTKGKVNINIDEQNRTIQVVDNGPGMPSSVMGKQFLEIAGTVKGTERASGGLGVAKMLFLYESKSLEAVSLRDGVISRLSTTGDDLKLAMAANPHTMLAQLKDFLGEEEIALAIPIIEAAIAKAKLTSKVKIPEIKVITTSDPATVEQYEKTLFPDGHGTSITIEVPKNYLDTSTGEARDIDFDGYNLSASPVLERSPLFDNIDVVVKQKGAGSGSSYETQKPIGAKFPLKDFTVFAGVKFNWGTARIYVTKAKVERYQSYNTHILSNGLWQFSKDTNDNPGYDGKPLPYTFYIDVASVAKPEDPGYPFDLNRQRFSPTATTDFDKIFNYISALYRQADLASSVKNFGTVQYINAKRELTEPKTLSPTVPASDNAVNLIRPGDAVEIRDGVIYVNNRVVPELTNADLKNTHIKIDELKIPQDELDPRQIMLHDNTKEKSHVTRQRPYHAEDKHKEALATLRGLVASNDKAYKFSVYYAYPSNPINNDFEFIYNLDTDNPTRIVDSADNIVYQLKDLDIIPRDSKEDRKSLTDTARDEFGDERINNYLGKIGAFFQLYRNALVAAGGGQYADLANEVIGTSVDIKYLGVSIKIPFNGMFINPCAIAYDVAAIGNRGKNPTAIAYAMIATMQHELAHFKVRSHDADFVSEFQKVMLLLKTFPGINLEQVERNFIKHIEDNLDIFTFLFKEFKDGNFEPRGDRFKDASYQQIEDGSIPDDNEDTSGAGELRQSLPPSSGKGPKDTGQVGISAGISGEAEEVREAVRSQKEVDAAVAVATNKFEESNKAEQFAKAATMLQMAQDPRKVIPLLQDIYNVLDVATRKFLVQIPTTQFLVDWASSSVPSLSYTSKLMQQMSGMTQQLLKSASNLVLDVDRAFRNDPALRGKLARITQVATLSEVDPADPNAKERNASLDRMYTDLGSEGQRVYKRVRDHFVALSQYFTKLLDDQISSSKLTLVEQKVIMKKIRAMYEKGPKITPYFALVRRGEYWLSVGKGKTRKFYMRETMAERDRLMRSLAEEKLHRRPNETNKAWETRRANKLGLLLEDQEFTYGNDISSLRRATVDNSEMLREIFDLVEKSNLQDAEAKEALKDAMYQIYLQTMPEQSFRKQFIHREGIAGASTDFLRDVATTTAKMATQLARIKYSPLLRNSLSQARDSIVNRPNQEPFVAEMEARVKDALKFANDDSVAQTIAKWLNKAAYIYYLGGASTALIQPLSIFQQGMPVLSKYGVVAANKEMLRMLKVWQHFGVYVTNPDGSKSWVAPSIEHGMGLSPNEVWAVKQMTSRDVASSTFAGSVFDYKETPTGNHSAPIVQFGKDTVNMLVLGGLMHSTERMSREVMFLSSFRLNMLQPGMKLLPIKERMEKAVDAAVHDTNEALGNYGDYNRPLWMKSATGKVLTQFMFYSLHVTLFLLKNFKEMIKPMDGHTRGEAAKKFFGTLGATYILAGVVGLPMFSTIMGILGWAWDELREDDWPEDIKSLSFELWFRTVYLKEQLGSTKIGGVSLATIVERGPVNAFSGIDFSSRTSLNNLWLRESKEEKTLKDTAIAFAIDHIGPSPNMLLAGAEAWEAFSRGDLEKGVRKMAPAGFRNVITANKLWTEGAKDSKGVQILSKDAFSTGLLIAQAVGFRSDLLANTQYVTFKVIGIEQKILNERQVILDNMNREYKDKNFKKFTDIVSKEVVKWNMRFPTYSIEDADINASLDAKSKQRAESFRGVTLNNQNAGLFIKALAPSRKAAAEAEKAGREKKAKEKSKE